MSWVTIIWAMIASACLTLAMVHLVIWFKQTGQRAHLLFSLTAISVAAIAACELLVMRAQTIERFGTVIRWAHLPVFFAVVSIVGFVRLYFHTGRPWLAYTVCGLRLLALIINFLSVPNLNYKQITGLRHLTILGGETISVAEGIPNPWTKLGDLSSLLLLIFVADASVTLWRRGNRTERRRALVIGGSITFFILVAAGNSALLHAGLIHTPYLISFPFLAIVMAMGYELSQDVLRAAQLSNDLRESEQRMSLAVDAANFGIWIRDFARNEIWATDKWRELFGFTPSERLKLECILQRLHPDDRETMRQALTKAVAGAGRYESEYRLMLRDGGMRWIASQGRVEFDAKGQPVLMRCTSLDCTARKQAEQEMLLLRQEIAHVGRVSMMGQLASALAHELNQPLGAILRNAEAAELFMENESPDLDEIRAILADIRKDDQRAGSVIDRMRALLKRRDLETRPLGLGELVGDVASLARADAASRQVKLDVDVAGGLPLVRGDRVHLQQVLLNLVLNGMDALNGVSPQDRCVSVTARLDGTQTVEIAVSDTGHGIPADKLAHVFDPFFTTKPNGIGMGLPISRTIVEAHGGRLWAENNNGGGAAFRFTLPIAEEAATG
jgi:two-component system, LuxR family, sensor kinase FixL